MAAEKPLIKKSGLARAKEPGRRLLALLERQEAWQTNACAAGKTQLPVLPLVCKSFANCLRKCEHQR